MVNKKIPEIKRLLDNPLVSRVFGEENLDLIREEVQGYILNSEEYIRNTIGSVSDSGILSLIKRGLSIIGSSLNLDLLDVPGMIRDYFRESWHSLVRDIRIFLFTNSLFFFVSAALCFIAIRKNLKILLLSFILSGIIAMTSFMFIFQNWIYNFFFNNYMGVMYPAILFILFTAAVIAAFWPKIKTIFIKNKNPE